MNVCGSHRQYLCELLLFLRKMILPILIALVAALLYYYGTKSYNYWSNRNVKHNKPVPFFGNNLNHYLQKASYTELATELYKQFPNEKVAGFYRGLTSELLIRDPDIIKHVLVADFQNFYVRGLGRDWKVEPMMKNVFHAEGDTWKLLRHCLTPAFTSGKLKNMFPLIVDCAEQLQTYAEKVSEKGETFDMKEMTARYTTNVIAACCFGINSNCLNDDNSEFRAIYLMTKVKFSEALKVLMKENFPNLFSKLKPFSQETENSILGLVQSILEQRDNQPVGRNDVIDILLEFKKQGPIVTQSIENKDTNQQAKDEIDLIVIAAHAYIFLIAGVDTSALSSSYTFHELAYHQELQKEIQNEIDTVLSKFDNKFSYEAVKEMKLLECALKEGMRKFPPAGVLNRQCVKKYKIPGTDITIDKGVKIIIPVDALHNDEKYFENPKEFNPKRFLPENLSQIANFTYLPFGEGPRQCTGTRLALRLSMTALAAVLHKFTVEPAPESKRELEVNHNLRALHSVAGGIPLLLKKRVS